MKIRITLGLTAGLLLAGLTARACADYIEYDLGVLGKAITELAGAKLQGVDMGKNSTILAHTPPRV